MAYVARLKKEYRDRIVSALTEEFGYKNVMQVPKLQKIVVSRGVGAAVADKKLIDHAIDEMTMITGQKAIATMSKKDVAAFKLSKGYAYWCQSYLTWRAYVRVFGQIGDFSIAKG